MTPRSLCSCVESGLQIALESIIHLQRGLTYKFPFLAFWKWPLSSMTFDRSVGRSSAQERFANLKVSSPMVGRHFARLFLDLG